MAASASDLFMKVARSTATTLSAPGYTAGVSTSINVGSTSNWPTDTGVIFAIDEVDSAGERVSGTYNVFIGVVSSATQISSVDYLAGDTERSYSAGASTRVYILAQSSQMNRLIDGILVNHNNGTNAGSHKTLTDSNGNEWIEQGVTASAVNQVKITNAATGNAPQISASGGDTNVGLEFIPKGTGNILFTHFYDWQKGSSTWTYASATTFTVPQSDADLMTVGTKIWLTQTTSKYFYVVSKSGTTITVTGGSDYSVANAAITAPYFSNAESPVGFPQWFNYTPTWTNITVGNGTLVGRFSLLGRTVNFSISLVFGTTTSVTGSFPTATLPITASASGRGRTQIIYNDNGVANYYGIAFISPSATTTVLTTISASGTYGSEIGVSSTVPFTFGSTDSAVILGNYEI